MWSCAAAAAASLVALGALVYFALPTGDDFCYASMHLRDVWPFVAHVYRQQGGRWSTTAIEGLSVAAIPDIVRGYPAVLAALLALRVACCYALARAVLDSGLGRMRCFAVAASFCLLDWCAMPSLGDSLFWMTGAFFYELPASGMLLFLAALWRGPLTGWRTAGLGVGAILLTGAHEVAALTLLAVVLAGAALGFLERASDRRWWYALLAVTAAGVLVAMLAPGNFVRAGQLGESHSVWRTLALTGSLLLGRMARWAIDLPLLLAAGSVLLDPGLRFKPEWTESGRVRRLAATAAAGGFSLSTGFLISAWAADGVMPGRLLNWLYLVFLATVFASLALRKPGWNLTAPRWALPVALTGTFVAMLAAGNPRLAAEDLASRVPQWSAAKLAALQAPRPAEHSPRFPSTRTCISTTTSTPTRASIPTCAWRGITDCARSPGRGRWARPTARS